MSFLSPASMFRLGEGLITTFSGHQGTKLPHELPNPYRLNNQSYLQEAQKRALDNQQQAQEQQSQLALSEGMINARAQGFDDLAQQAAAASGYNNSGVLQEGSPSLVLERRRQLMQQVINAGVTRSIAQANLFREQGLLAHDQGTAQMLGQQQQQAMGAASFDAEQALSRLSGLPKNDNVIKSLAGLLPGFQRPPVPVLPPPPVTP
jgi:hypothetical protein